ncbi:MAG: hypothetical protein OHK0052_08120 [Anaerolineales bacterium]
MQKFALIDNFLVALWGAVLLVTLIGSVIYLLVVLYLGFTVSPTTGRVMQVFVRNSEIGLKPGTMLTKIELNDQMTCSMGVFFLCDWQALMALRLGTSIEHATVRVTLDDGSEIEWGVVRSNIAEFLERFSGTWLGAIIFCIGGGALLVKGLLEGDLERLLLLQSSLWALALIGLAWLQSGIGLGGLLFTLAFWLLLPAYLQFYWMFPQPLSRLPRAFWMVVYVLAAVVGTAVIWQQPQHKIWYLFNTFAKIS